MPTRWRQSGRRPRRQKHEVLGQNLDPEEDILTCYGHGLGRHRHAVLALLVLQADEQQQGGLKQVARELPRKHPLTQRCQRERPNY